MIRHTGILAGVVSVAILLLLIARTHTAEISGHISGAPPFSDESFVIYKPDTHALYVQSTAKEGLLKEWGPLLAAGISIIGVVGPIRGRTDQDADLWICRLGDIPLEAVSAARPGDVLRIRGRSLYLKLGDGLHRASHLTYEVQRGTSTLLFSGEGNSKFAAICISSVAAPIALWLLGVALAGLSYTIRKGFRQIDQ